MDAKGTLATSVRPRRLPDGCRCGEGARFLYPSDVDLGYGEVGGYLESFAKEGRIVGGIAIRILDGERGRKDIPIVRGANAYMSDWRALSRWGFRRKRPPDRKRGAVPSSVVLGAHQMGMGRFVARRSVSKRSRLVSQVEASEKPAIGAQWHADYRTGKGGTQLAWLRKSTTISASVWRYFCARIGEC